MTTSTAKLMIVCGSMAFAYPAFAGDIFYRYQNPAGETLIDSAVPSPEKTNKYEILDDEGKVLQAVSQSGTPTPVIEPKEAVLQRLQMHSIQDKALLAQFKTVKEIEALKGAATQSLQEEINGLKALQRAANAYESQQKIALQLQFKEISLAEMQASFDKKITRYRWLTQKN